MSHCTAMSWFFINEEWVEKRCGLPGGPSHGEYHQSFDGHQWPVTPPLKGNWILMHP